MNVTITPASVRGTIAAPASKSCTQRALAAALLSKGEWLISGAGKSDDERAALDIIQQLGAIVTKGNDGSIRISSNGVHPTGHTIDAGESGLSLRMFTPIAALCNKPVTITGKGSLLNRPMDALINILPQLGVVVHAHKETLPFTIQGPLRPSDVTIDGSVSSQYLTGLLMAYGSLHNHSATVHVSQLASRQYIDLTIEVIRHFGLNVPENDNYKSFHFEPVRSTAKSHVFQVEGDWSGAAFPLVAGAISGEVCITGLNPLSAQPDRKILEVLEAAGCRVSRKENSLCIQSGELTPFHFDASGCPDLFPPLAVLAAFCNGTSTISGVHRLFNKESNRAVALEQELLKMNIDISVSDDKMIVAGKKGVCGARVHSHHDHRIAMACAVAAVGAEGETVIEEAQVVNKSYPDFYQHFRQLRVPIFVP